ncbi:MAG: HDOD domain-containing protein [Thermoguttaceae bacterium]
MAVRVIEVASNPASGAADLKQVLERDPALTARLLRCVNSSAYPVQVPITNLQQAIAYLGVKQVRNLVLTASFSRMFTADGGIGPYRRGRLWEHMVSVAVCARMIASREKFANSEDVFLAGLLHDIGIILEDQFAHQQFCKMLSRGLSPQKPLVECEQEYFAFDHTSLGEKFAQRWKFPSLVTAAIAWHHRSMSYEQDDKLSVRSVELANAICSAKGITSVGLNLVEFVQPEAMGFSMSRDDLACLIRELDQELARHGGLFEI